MSYYQLLSTSGSYAREPIAFSIVSKASSYLVISSRVPYDSVTGDYGIAQVPTDRNAQLLPRGYDLAPKNSNMGGGYWTWRDQNTRLIDSLSVKIESPTSRVVTVYGLAFPSRYIHDPKVGIEVTARSPLPGTNVGANVSVFFEYAQRSGVDENGYDSFPDQSGTWTAVGGGFAKSVYSNGDERIYYANSDGVSKRTDWDVEGSRDFVRIGLQINTATQAGWPQSGLAFTAKLYVNDLMWQKNPYSTELGASKTNLESGDWSVPRNGDFQV
jgi:hypothetical protein